MAASETLRFDIIGRDLASDAFLRAGRSVSDMGGKMAAAASKAAFLDDALKRQRSAARATTDATLALAKSDDILTEVEHRLRDGALEAEWALKRETEAKKKNAEATRKAAEENKGFAASLARVADSAKKGGGPAWLPWAGAAVASGLGTSLLGVTAGAAVGLGGAAIAGAGALAAFGAIAKPVLAATLTAEQKVNTAQNNYTASIAAGVSQAKAYKAEQLAIGKAYADLSPQQIALSKQLGNMAQAWQNLKAAQTPVVAGALQPWLRSVTDLTGKLAPIIAKVSPVIRSLGTQFGILVNSSVFNAFRDFIANTGSKVVGAAGNALIDLLDGFIVLLPKFAPLMTGAANAVSGWGDSFARWANSQKAADDITKFMGWFSKNGPAVGGLLKNIGLALKALAPGLGPAATMEINVISGFFGLIAKLPRSIAKPLLEVAGVMLTLNKLGVVAVGVKLLGGGAAGGAGAAAGSAAAGGAAAGLWGRLLPGVRFAAGSLAAVIAVSMVLKNTSSGPGGKNWWDNPFGADPKSKDPAKQGLSTWAGLGHMIEHVWDLTWNNVVGRLTRGLNDVDKLLGRWEHNVAHWFDTARHDVAHIWDLTWNNTVGRLNSGMNDTDRLLGGWEHDVARWFGTARHDIASIWDLSWHNTVDRAARGIGDVVRWFAALPGKATGALHRLGGDMLNTGTWAIGQLWAGLKSVAGNIGGGGVIGWLGGFARGVVGVFRKVWGWFSPSSVMYEGGKSLMTGLANGIKDHAHLAQKQVASVGNIKYSLMAGVTQWEPVVARALAMEGLSQDLMRNVMFQMQTESGGNPNAINNWDINAQHGDPSRGLLQVIGSTFSAYHWPGTSWNIYDPLANIAAAINYARNVYGPNLANQYGGIGSGRGYAAGTMSAAPGWAWVGESGRELMHFRGGEQVYPAQAVAAAGGGTQTIIIQVDPAVAAVTPDRTLGRHIAEHVTQFIKGGGRLYPQGVTPR